MLFVGDRVRINAQLIDGRTDQHLWAQVYERDLQDAMDMLGEVTRAIAGQINVTLTPQVATRLAMVRRLDPKAQDLYLRGRQRPPVHLGRDRRGGRYSGRPSPSIRSTPRRTPGWRCVTSTRACSAASRSAT